MKANEIKIALQKLQEYEEAERLEYIQRCEKCGSLKIVAYATNDYPFASVGYGCECGNRWEEK